MSADHQSPISTAPVASPKVEARMRRALAADDAPERLLADRLRVLEPAAAGALAARTFLRLPPKRHATPSREREWVAAGGTALTFAGGTLAATGWGAADGRPVALLVHGWEGRGSQMGAFAAPLVAGGWRVVALDGPAHGGSAGANVHVEDFARALTQVGRELAAAGQAVRGVVGHSFGAGAAVAALGREGFTPERLVLLAGPASVAAVLDRFAAQFGFGTETRGRFFAAAEEELGVPLHVLDSARFGGENRVPVLVLHDPDDREVPFGDAETLVANWGAAATLVACPGRGHRRILRDVAVAARATHFLLTGDTGAGPVPPPAPNVDTAEHQTPDTVCGSPPSSGPAR